MVVRWRFIFLIFWFSVCSLILYNLENLTHINWEIILQTKGPFKFFKSVKSKITQYPITFVTGFIDIGTINKVYDGVREKSTYFEWVKVYGRFNSPLIIYTNDPVFLQEVYEIREKYMGITKLIFLEDIFKLKGFKYYNETKKLFDSPKYPKIYGITDAKYCCVMHSKHDFLEMSIKKNYFNTPYYAWTDIGSVRYMGGSNETLNVTLPSDFNDSRIAFYEKHKLKKGESVANVMKSYSVWITGNFFMGTSSLMLQLVRQYQQFVDKMIALNLMSTDENIFNAMYTEEAHTPDMVDIQVYHGPEDSCDPWFHLMYLVTNHSCLRKGRS